MKIKTSITISENLIVEIDSFLQDNKNRSQFIEEAIIAYIEKRKRLLRDKKDLVLINNKAKSLNKEASDVLNYQVKL
ncbi:MAG: hypothetical protein JW969_04640 [Spirochaetales bacterium]|nr:hypothetical protein [Spirochaetales bacterium]